ncbi:MAG: hypothetical protein M3463_11520 [Verrucomicrobiota bacterium]|nr:hypothetical protein [Verrucomicrobiota bacterium]
MKSSHRTCLTKGLLLLTTLMPLQAQDFERIAPKPAPLPPGSATGRAPSAPVEPARGGATSDAVLVGRLRSVVLVPNKNEVRTSRAKGAEGVHLQGLNAPAPEKLRKAIASRYLGKPLSLASVNELTRDIIRHYRAQDRPVIDVIVPEQEVTGGVLQLIVIESRLGEVRAEGNRWFESSLLESGIRAAPGEVIRGSDIVTDLDWINQNAFRQVDAIYTPGREFGTTDLVLQTRDRSPVRVYAGFENTGTETTDENRWLAGFNWGNAFGLDHQLSYQFTTSDDFETLRAHSLSYVAPLPWRHTLTLFGAYAESDVDLQFGGVDFNTGGESFQASARYSVPLPAFGLVTHRVFAGFDFKRTNNDLEFGGTQVFDSHTDIFQWLLGYEISARDGWGWTSLGATTFYSPGDLGGDNEDDAFEQSRAFASADYVYGRLVLQRVNRLPGDLSLALRAVGQWSDGNLLASEQLGVGGYDSVRGYEEREARGDSGYLLSAELRSPPLSLLGRRGATSQSVDGKNGKTLAPAARTMEDQLQFLAFWDYGVARLHDPLPAEDQQVNFSSAGVGLRYTFNPYMSVRFDYGWPLVDTAFRDSFHGRGHLGVVVSY